MMKTVILDGYAVDPGDLSWDSLKQFGELKVHDRSVEGEDQVKERVRDAQIVVTRRTPLPAGVLESAPGLRLIIALSGGAELVDREYAAGKGIAVSVVPEDDPLDASQFAAAMLFEICHHVGHHDYAVKGGRWSACKDDSFWDLPQIRLRGKTAGIAGSGEAGQALSRILASVGMNVLVCGEGCPAGDAGSASEVSFDELLAASDVVFLFCEYSEKTGPLIGRTAIEKMKDGAVLINTYDGRLVDEDALCDALESGKLSAAGLDRASAEPLPLNSRLLRQPDCVVTPHLSRSFVEARAQIIRSVEDAVRAFITD